MVMTCVSCLFRYPPDWIIHGASVGWFVYSFIYLEIFILSPYGTRQGSFLLHFYWSIVAL